MVGFYNIQDFCNSKMFKVKEEEDEEEESSNKKFEKKFDRI